MYIKKISLKNFRNYENLIVEPIQGINILQGNNAQGKTNILEAIYYASFGRTFRTGKVQDLIIWDNNFFNITFEIFNFSRNISLEIRYDDVNKKNIFVNGVKKNKISDLVSNLKVVLFAPDDLNLIKGNPSERRRFLDSYITQLSPQYYHDLKQYEKVLYQRNTLLKSVRERKSSAEFLQVWDQQLWNYGSRIILKRLETLKKMGPIIKRIHLNLTETEDLEVKYLSSVKINNDISIDNIKKSFEDLTKTLVKEEIRKGVTLTGPHRDDLSFSVNTKSLQTFGSQGQQRTAVLSVKLAEMELIKVEHGIYPILLLDDVMSELDLARRNFLLDFIKEKVQVFITTTNLHSISDTTLKSSKIFRVAGGKIVGGI